MLPASKNKNSPPPANPDPTKMASAPTPQKNSRPSNNNVFSTQKDSGKQQTETSSYKADLIQLNEIGVNTIAEKMRSTAISHRRRRSI
jgi:hypothetical protein